jgi:hypothetical protein
MEQGTQLERKLNKYVITVIIETVDIGLLGLIRIMRMMMHICREWGEQLLYCRFRKSNMLYDWPMYSQNALNQRQDLLCFF